MAPDTAKMGATLDADELSYLRQRFKQPGSENGGKMSVSQVVECIEHLDFIIDGEAEDLVRSVVPAALKADSLSLEDVIKVAAAAKEQEGSGGPEGVSREDSLAELRSSFQLQVDTGEIPEMTLDGAPRTPPELDRNDSLAQLESSFHRQVLSGGIPSMGSIAEAGKDGVPHPPSPGVVRVDEPMRRRSVTGSSPGILAAPVIWQTPARADSLTALQRSVPHGEGPEPILVDIPQRRASVTRPGGGSMVGLQPAPSGLYEKETKGKKGRGWGMGSPPISPELKKQTSEEELLDTAANIGLDPVEALNVPKKRHSFTVPKDWSEAAAKESLKALSLKTLREDEEAEVDRQQLESEAARQEVGECLRWLAGEAEKNWAVAQARKDAERKAAEATARAERVEAARAQLEVEGVLRFVVDTLEKEAAIAKAREEAEEMAAAAAEAAAVEAETRVNREAAAREAAELKAVEAARRAEEALRLVAVSEQEAKTKEEALRAAAVRAEEVAAGERAAFLKAEEHARAQAEEGARKRQEEEGRSVAARAALEEEARLLRSKLQEAGEEAAERAHEDAEARVVQEALEKQQALERGEREARLLREAAESAGRAAEAREAGEREARGWKEKFEAAQKEREEEAKKAEAAAMERQTSAVAKAVADARKFEEERARVLRAAEEHRHSLEGANVSFEDVDTRTGRAWWQCIVCDPEIDMVASEVDMDSAAGDEEDTFAAAVDNVKPEAWMKSKKTSYSARTLGGDSFRTRNRDVCSIM